MNKIVMLCVPPGQGVDVLGPLEAFGMASRILEETSGHRGYESELVTSSSDLLIPTITGVGITAHKHYWRERGQVDTLLIAGGAGARGPTDPAVSAWPRKVAKQPRRVCSVVTGACLPANACLSNGNPPPTH